MRCEDIKLQLPDYLDNDLEADEAEAVRAHLEACGPCCRCLEAEKVWRESFRDLPAPTLSGDRKEELLAAAHARHSGRYSRSAPWIGGAIAASLVFGLALGMNWPGSDPQSLQPEVASRDTVQEQAEPLVSETVRTVRLAFNADKPMQGVTLTLEMPAHAELATYPGQQRLTWEVDLDEGENILALPMRVLYPDDGEIVAQLSYGGQQSTFRAPIPGNGGKKTDTGSAL